MVKRIFRFSKELCDWDGHPAEAKKRLGGKGAGLVLMAQDNMPVPPGFTITTDVCNEFRKLGDAAKADYLEQLMVEVMEQMDWLKEQFGYMPLVSVRSGAPISMPGMMDTILNVGLTASNHKEWQARIGERATLDSQRRLVQMLGSTAYGVPHQVFEFQLAKVKKDFGAETDADLNEGALDDLIERYCNAFEDHRGFPFPIDNRYEQLLAAIEAVFNSWMNERAVEYRKLNNIDESMGTAVTIQAMVFGNMGEDSGSGVAFTRNPSTGEPVIMGEYLSNAQGEDVVAGIRTPESLSKYITPSKDHYLISCPWAKELAKVCETLEQMYADMVDLEFTVQEGELFILQSRVGKRSARAAFKIAVDLTEDKVIDRKLALARLTGAQFKVLRRPSIDPGFKVKPQLIGLPACPGVVTGTPVFSAEAAVAASGPVVLVTAETTPDDIAGMAKAVGILTQTGGATSHAAVVARAMDKPCVVGCTALDFAALKKAKTVTIDGGTGNVWIDVKVPVTEAYDTPEIRQVMDWCLAVMGACDVVPVDVGMERPHRVMAAYWWGNVEVMEAILDGIAELPSRQHVTLDLRGPNAFRHPDDAALDDCFGTVPAKDPFLGELLASLLMRAGQLKGLVLAHPPAEVQSKLWEVGYAASAGPAQMVPNAVPADYATFTVLGR